MDGNLTVIVCVAITGGVLSLVALLTYVYHLKTFNVWAQVREKETELALMKLNDR